MHKRWKAPQKRTRNMVLRTHGRITADSAEAKPFLPLAQTIPDQASDVDTWKAVLDLIAEVTKTTPDRSIPPSFYPSASKQGSVLREELRDCSFVNVEGFFEKYVSWTLKREKGPQRTMDCGSVNNASGWATRIISEELLATHLWLVWWHNPLVLPCCATRRHKAT